MSSFLLDLFIVIGIIIVAAVSLSGSRIAIQRFFDIYIEKKLFLVYLLFYTILLSIMSLFISQSFFGGGLLAFLIIILYILAIVLVEYLLIYKRYFDYEPGGKYILYVTVSYLFSFVILLLISSLLIIVLILFRG
jgi:uncharacterized membrane protein YhaH (DUF805 family)